MGALAAAPIPGPDVVTVAPRQKFDPWDTDCHDLRPFTTFMTFLTRAC